MNGFTKHRQQVRGATSRGHMVSRWFLSFRVAWQTLLGLCVIFMGDMFAFAVGEGWCRVGGCGGSLCALLFWVGFLVVRCVGVIFPVVVFPFLLGLWGWL
jgi:hypothetical protein